MSRNHSAAQALAHRGVAVFACAPGAKVPLISKEQGGSGFADASTDVRQIDAWWRSCPDANIGIPMGFRTGLYGVDVDCKNDVDGRETLATLERELGRLPLTLTAETWSGGEHRYFRMPPVALRNTVRKLGPGVDTRGEGGYVLAPPSVIDGRPYRWTVRARPAALPPAWLEALMPREQPSTPAEPWAPRDDRERSRASAWCLRALQKEARKLADAPKGSRNDRIWRAASAMGGLVHLGAVTAEDVRSALLWACSTWSHRDARKDSETLERGLHFGLAYPRTIHLEDGSRAA